MHYMVNGSAKWAKVKVGAGCRFHINCLFVVTGHHNVDMLPVQHQTCKYLIFIKSLGQQCNK